MPDRQTLYQKVYLAKQTDEATVATSGFVYFNQMTPTLGVVFEGNAEVNVSGSEWQEDEIEGDEQTNIAFAGPASVKKAAVVMAAVHGNVTATQIGTTGAYTRIWELVQGSPVSPLPFTTEYGDGASNNERCWPGWFTGWNFTFSRSEATMNAGSIFKPMELGATLTGGASINARPLIPKKNATWMDPTAAAIGTTKLVDNYECTIAVNDMFLPNRPMDDTIIGFKNLIRVRVPMEVTIRPQANTVGLNSILTRFRNSAPCYFRFRNIGRNLGTGADETIEISMCMKLHDGGDRDDQAPGIQVQPWTFRMVNDPSWTTALNGSTAPNGRAGQIRIVAPMATIPGP